MRRVLLVCTFLIAAVAATFAQPAPSAAWKAKVAETMPLLGHRNWILIVDSAYPLQVSPGIETVETGAGQLEVLEYVLHSIRRSIHVRPVISMDAELPYVPEDDAPGVTVYRNHVADLLHEYAVESLPHEKIIARIAQAGEKFHVLILKTDMTVPYTSVFIRLDCKYWSADAESRLRERMKSAAAGGAAQPSPQAPQ